MILDKPHSHWWIYLIAIFCAMLNVVDIELAGFSKILPMFDVMIIFYFSVFLGFFSVGFIFLLGLFNDALNGNPLGLTSLIYIILIQLFAIVNDRLIVREDFKQILMQFVAFLFCFLLLKWAMMSLFVGDFLDIKILVVQLIISSIFYVLMHNFCDFLARRFLFVK